MEQITDSQLIEIAELARDQQVAMDVNGHIDREPAYVLAIRRFFKICCEVGVKFTFGSDAHHLQKLGKSQALVDAITYFDLNEDDILSADELLARS